MEEELQQRAEAGPKPLEEEWRAEDGGELGERDLAGGAERRNHGGGEEGVEGAGGHWQRGLVLALDGGAAARRLQLFAPRLENEKAAA